MATKKKEEPKPIYYTPTQDEESKIQELILEPTEPIITKRTDALKWLVYHGMKNTTVSNKNEPRILE